MSVSIIYQHEQRGFADEWRKLLENAGYKVVLAPIGYEVGSHSWQSIVKHDIESADAVLVLLTEKAIEDEWFDWRVQTALDLKKIIIPILLENVNKRSFTLASFQYLMARNQHEREMALKHLTNYLPKPKRKPSCFISYSREDEHFAARLAADLHQKNINIWIDTKSIRAGAVWDNEIQNALKNCTHVLLIATPRSVVSTNVCDEIAFALDKKKTIVPIIIEECELPLRVHRAQRLDFSANYDSALNELLRNLEVSFDETGIA